MTGVVVVTNGGCRGGGGRCRGGKGSNTKREVNRQSQLSVIAMLMATIRKSMVHCKMSIGEEEETTLAAQKMEIGWPTEVRHVAHVTFDRFNGFLGLPVEFELEVPCPAPSASMSVFGVSSESMQCGYDSNGNSVPTILLLMQERLYAQGGLKAEGIFRINPENSEEKELRNQLNKGIIPYDIDVHCLAALIKAWFRELPKGILESLSPGQVLQCETEEDCVELVKLLPPTQFALLSWAIDLMTDVVEEEETNKMDARNITMVFAPNMTQLSDPLIALMHAVQVMNLLQTLIYRTLREREDAALMEGYSLFSSSSSSESRRDYDSGELRENSSDDYKEDMCFDLADDTSDFQFNIYSTSIYEDDKAAGVIEECFLKQVELDLKEEEHEPSRLYSELSFSKSSTESCISKAQACQGISLRISNELESALVEDQNVVSDTKPAEQIEDQNVVSDTKPAEQIEDDKEVEVDVLNSPCHEYAVKDYIQLVHAI